MNKVTLIGRLTKEPEVRSTSKQEAFCNFTVAVDRKYKDANGNKLTDFINCVAWRQQASLIGSYFHKGSRICIMGNIQSRSYDGQNGQKVYVTEVIVEEIEFIDTKSDNQQNESAQVQSTNIAPTNIATAPANSFEQLLVQDSDAELPFEV